jgi:hypothetical protein
MENLGENKRRDIKTLKKRTVINLSGTSADSRKKQLDLYSQRIVRMFKSYCKTLPSGRSAMYKYR